MDTPPDLPEDRSVRPDDPPRPEPLTNAEKTELKRRAARHEPIVRVGHAGVSPEFLRSLDEALTAHELVKIKFAVFKEQKKKLAPQIARQTGSELISRVGNVAVYFRRKTAAPRPAPAPPTDLTPGALE